MTDHSRRNVLKLSAAAAAASAAAVTLPGRAAAESRAVSGPYPEVSWPEDVAEGPDTPKLCQWFSRNPDEAAVRRWRQAGVTGALVTDPPPLPWSAATLRADRDRLESQGLHITAYLIAVSQSIVQGTAARDADLEKVIASVRAAGEAGIPVVEYNWYIHRLTEGYYEQIDETDRLGAGYTAFDADREVDGVKVKDLPPRDGTPIYTREQLWENYAYFLERVVPVAEEAGVRLAVHPNDPPYQVSRGNPQIMGSVPDWQRMVETVDSPSNGMTVHSGVTAEVGFDSVSFLRWMARKDRVNHIHYRNVVVEEPHVRYAEVFPDNGQTDMFAFMRELVRSGYHLGVLAEHPRALDFDRENGSIGGQYAGVGGGGHGGELYDTGYARAMLQAAMITEKHR